MIPGALKASWNTDHFHPHIGSRSFSFRTKPSLDHLHGAEDAATQRLDGGPEDPVAQRTAEHGSRCQSGFTWLYISLSLRCIFVGLCFPLFFCKGFVGSFVVLSHTLRVLQGVVHVLLGFFFGKSQVECIGSWAICHQTMGRPRRKKPMWSMHNIRGGRW